MGIRHFSKDRQVAKKHMQKQLMSQVIRELPIKTCRANIHPLKQVQAKIASQVWRTKFIHCPQQHRVEQPLWEKVQTFYFFFSIRQTIKLTYNPGF
jgi:hypothetical protein